jgi:hypothetical protein
MSSSTGNRQSTDSAMTNRKPNNSSAARPIAEGTRVSGGKIREVRECNDSLHAHAVWLQPQDET